MGRTAEFFENFDGAPCDILWTDDFMSEQGKEKLFRIYHKAMHEDYIICASIQKKMKDAIKDKEKFYLPDKLGLKNCHSYHIIKIQEVELDNGDLEYLLFIRNPTGNIYLKDNEVSKLKWNPRDEESWTPKVRKQCNYYTTLRDYVEALKRAKVARKAFKAQKKDPYSKERLMDTWVRKATDHLDQAIL